VTRGAKFGIYKRCGHRVLINKKGDMLVRGSSFLSCKGGDL